jgi:flagellar motor switch protein FliN
MTVNNIEYEELNEEDQEGSALGTNFDLVKNVKVNLSVYVGDCELSVEELFSLQSGSVVSLDRELNSPVDIRLEDRLVARGELVVVDDNFGVKITEIEQQ